ncbi:MAG TPA: TonB-dependent receptor [Longimicrobiales bacterium]|nr:TonB-dependent receptor [Longimicrobiales bacterium]
MSRFIPSPGRTPRLLIAVLACTLFAPAGSITGHGPATGALSAQERTTGLIDGRVTATEAGAPLAGVMVEVVGTDRRTVTDEEGRFRLSGVDAGTATLRFHLIGRTILEQRVQVPASGVARPLVALAAAPVPLDPLLVLQSRTQLSEGVDRDRIPGSVHRIGTRALTERPVVFDDVHAFLREIPGVNVSEEDGYGLRPNIGMRGTGVDRSAKITLMEDGVLIAPAPYAAPAAYYFPVVGRMSAVEVRKGSSQIRYGPSTVGGAVNMVSTPIPADFSLSLDASGGTEDSQRLLGRVGDAGTHWGWLVEGYRSRTDGFKQLDGGGNTGFDVEDYLAKFRVNTDLDADVYQELELKLQAYDERSDETYLGLTRSDFAVAPDRRYAASQEDVMNADHQTYQLRHFVQLRSGLDLTTTAYRNETARSWYKLQSVLGRSIGGVLANPEDNADALVVLRGGDAENALTVRNNNREYLSQGIQTLFGVGFGDAVRHDLEIGIRYHEDEEDRFQEEDVYSMTNGQMILSAPGTPGTQANRVGAASAVAIHVQDRIVAGPWTLTPGLRWESIDLTRTDYAPGDAARGTPDRVRESEVSALIPGIGVGYELAEGAMLFAGVHRGFGSPGPGSDDETEAEKSVNYEVGTRLGSGSTSFEVTGFFSDYDNILGVSTLSTGGDGTGEAFNGGAVHALGLELSGSVDPLAGGASALRMPIRVSGTLSRATFQTAFESDFDPWGDVTEGDRLPYLPTLQGFVSVGLERGPWSGRLDLTAASEMRTSAGQGDPADEARTDAFAIVGLGLDYEVQGGATAYLAVQNLLDDRYIVAARPAGVRPGLPQTLQVGVRIAR